MMRYRPPKGTAGLARSAVNGCRRAPTPPARIILMVLSCMRTSTHFERMFASFGSVFSFQPGEVGMRLGWSSCMDWRRDRCDLIIVQLIPEQLNQLTRTTHKFYAVLRI